jgi:DNA repair protein RecO (recombination protein O)
MEWSDEGIVLGVRRYGESSVIVEAMTPGHGRHSGLVRGGRSARMRPILQPGNSVGLIWRARLSEHLGNFAVEPAKMRAAALMETQTGLYGLQLVSSHLRLLPERDPHNSLYQAALIILDNLDEPQKAARLLIRFELALLDELGFGLDLSRCVATGSHDELVWVSPKSGKAVSRHAGAPYADRLLQLPEFLLASQNGKPNVTNAAAIDSGFALTGYFLDRHVWSVRDIRPSEERAGFIRSVMKILTAADMS